MVTFYRSLINIYTENIPELLINSIILLLSKHMFKKIINFASQKCFNVDVYSKPLNTEQENKNRWEYESGSGTCFKKFYFRLFQNYYLEAHPINSNKQLLEFSVKSRNVKWNEFIVPLRKRGVAMYLGSNFNNMDKGQIIDDENRREILVCHDMMGNYRDDRHYNSSKKWDDYRYYHWSGVDYFCYFSHNYITIPPCNWINAAHKHGVRVIGTFITEHNDGRQRIIEILRTDESIKRTVNALVFLCQHFCFEGWLINIECSIPKDLVDKLVQFVVSLKTAIAHHIPDGIVFWYDSIIENGSVKWQNEVNDNNIRFFHAADGILVNYAWNDVSLINTRLNVGGEGVKTFFGIDVFARGQVAKFQTNQTMEKIEDAMFSTGFFAPGWTFESLNEYGLPLNNPNGSHLLNNAFLERNEKFWWLVWDHFGTHSYAHLPFYTDFCLGSGEYTFRHGEKVDGPFFCLSKQSLQPSVPLHGLVERDYHSAFNGGSCLKIVKPEETFRLFAFDCEIRQHLVVAYAFKLKEHDGDLDCIIRFSKGNESNDCYIFMGNYNNGVKLFKGRCYISPMQAEHFPAINKFFLNNRSHIKIPFALENDWQVRYYLTSFDAPVRVRGMGLLYRKDERSSVKEAYFGALYINEFTGYLPAELFRSNHVYLNLLENGVLN